MRNLHSGWDSNHNVPPSKCSIDFGRLPPPDCAHVVIGGHLVLLNRRTHITVDIFHFESCVGRATGTAARRKEPSE